MGEVFVTLLNRSIAAGWFILAVLCFRLVFRKSPKWVNCPLAFGEVGVKERVKSVLHYKKPALWIVIAAVAICVILAICFLTNPAKEYQIRVTIPAGSTKPVCYSDAEIIPKGNTVTFYAGEGLGDTEISLLPIEVREENAYDEPAYLTPGTPVKMDVEKGAWFKIGVNVQNPTNADKIVYVLVRGVEVRIASSEETENSSLSAEQMPSEEDVPINDTRLTTMLTFSKEGETEQKQASLVTGNGFSFYLPDDEQWHLSSPDFWTTDLNEQVSLGVTHFEGESVDSVNQKLDGDGYDNEDSHAWRNQAGDLIRYVELKVFENDIWGIFYSYPADSEEGWGQEFPVIANTFAISNGTDSETKISVNDSYYSRVTDISRTEVEDYANYIKQLFMEHDWLAISSEILYPIKLSGTTYTDREAFLNASNHFDSNLNEKFFGYLEEEDCVDMFINSYGIMLGETGQVWIVDVLDEKSNLHGLKILAINDLLKE